MFLFSKNYSLAGVPFYNQKHKYSTITLERISKDNNKWYLLFSEITLFHQVLPFYWRNLYCLFDEFKRLDQSQPYFSLYNEKGDFSYDRSPKSNRLTISAFFKKFLTCCPHLSANQIRLNKTMSFLENLRMTDRNSAKEQNTPHTDR